jgi:hypothetical protein
MAHSLGRSNRVTSEPPDLVAAGLPACGRGGGERRSRGESAPPAPASRRATDLPDARRFTL